AAAPVPPRNGPAGRRAAAAGSAAAGRAATDRSGAEPGEGGHGQGTDAGVQGGLDERGERGTVVDGDVLVEGALAGGLGVAAGVDASDAPVGERHPERPGDLAHVLA